MESRGDGAGQRSVARMLVGIPIATGDGLVV